MFSNWYHQSRPTVVWDRTRSFLNNIWSLYSHRRMGGSNEEWKRRRKMRWWRRRRRGNLISSDDWSFIFYLQFANAFFLYSFFFRARKIVYLLNQTIFQDNLRAIFGSNRVILHEDHDQKFPNTKLLFYRNIRDQRERDICGQIEPVP